MCVFYVYCCFNSLLPGEPRVCVDRETRYSKSKTVKTVVYPSNRIIPVRALGPRLVTDEIRSNPVTVSEEGTLPDSTVIVWWLCTQQLIPLMIFIQHCNVHRITWHAIIPF